MKRYGHLYDQAFTPAALWQGYIDARRSKGGRRACFKFERRIGAEFKALLARLHEGRYQPERYFKFMVMEPKPRQIYAPAFRDCVVQHAIYNAVLPIFERTFIHTSFACRRGKGTHKAADYAQQALQRCKPGSYTLQLDIRKFFYRIDRGILQKLIERKIKDPRMVRVMMQFADYDQPVGIPIGNLLSQLYALIYMNPVDQFITRELKPAGGYCRYVDDFILFGLTREQAVGYRQRIIQFLDERLQLELSRSTIALTTRGVNFVGYRTWASARFVRKHSLYKARRSIRAGRLESVVSHLAHAAQTHSLQHLLDYALEHNHALYRALPKTYHSRHHAPAQHTRGCQRALHAGRLDVCEPA
ncbi:MAG: hypothetical protein CMK75_03930 [Pseudomonadales bacterium]|nr:hypothetical protein [Pseudomonadales bacterium]